MTQQKDIFDKIRIKPSKKEEAKTAQRCEHAGCEKPGPHRAPKGRGHENQYWNFCVEHVRAYNLSYNYFQGMPDEAVANFQKSAQTGHRPTWSMGVKGMHDTGGHGQKNVWAEGEGPRDYEDPFGLFKDGKPKKAAAPQKPVGNSERKAFHALNLEIHASKSDIKLRYKEMVKRFHPDANGGDKAFEEKLREIIQAYTQLKNSGFC
ncbi:MAG: J domain-containing protein [Pseudomonadota bacterium]